MELLRCSAAVALLLTGVNALNSTHENEGIHAFGPANCIHLTRTAGGSCMISTNCQGLDISSIEFAFNCVNHLRSDDHHFGKGGFEDNEDFDTGIKCAKCLSIAQKKHKKHRSHHHKLTAKKPQPGHVSRTSFRTPRRTHELPQKQADSRIVLKARLNEAELALRQDEARVVTLRSQLAAKESPKPTKTWPTHEAEAMEGSGHVNFALHRAHAEYWPFKGDHLQETLAAKKYGPKDCISIWRNEVGHCVMKTKCQGVNMTGYEYGLVCVGSDGVMTRHSFGQDSFDEEENFDTLVSCSKCLPTPDGPASLMSNIKSVKKDIQELASDVKVISASVQRLKTKVFGNPHGPAPSPAVPPSPASAIQVEEPDDVE